MSRPLVLTADPDLLDDVLRLAATAGLEVEVAHEPGAARAAWSAAPLVLLGADVLEAAVVVSLPRRAQVAVLGQDLDDAGIWQRAVAVGAEHVVFLPDAERWIVDALTEAVAGRREPGRLVAVVGGRGGAGATTLAVALSLAAVRRGRSVLVVDGDPLGGGIDLVLHGEHANGLRWPDLVGTRGRLAGDALVAALPRLEGLSVLSWDRGEPATVPVDAVAAVLAAARQSADLVVADLPRTLDDATREVLTAADTTLLVVPAELRAAAAAARVAARLGSVYRDLRLVVRGPAPGRLSAEVIARTLALPLAGEVAAGARRCGRTSSGGRRPADGPGRRWPGSATDLLDDLEGRGAADGERAA